MNEKRKLNRRREARPLSDEEIALLALAIAPLIIKNVKEVHHEFWIDPEKHYKDHVKINRLDGVFTEDLIAALKEVAESYKMGRKLFWKMFLGLVTLGAIATAFVGWWHGGAK